MERVNKILSSKEYQDALMRTERAEIDRIYCLHGLEHALDVARICYIINLEQKSGIKKDVIYAASLLHDIGRFKQYEDGTPHHIASEEIAGSILPKCGYTENETSAILHAVCVHRSAGSAAVLGEILQKADDLSRICLNCKARSTCKWQPEEMNMKLSY